MNSNQKYGISINGSGRFGEQNRLNHLKSLLNGATLDQVQVDQLHALNKNCTKIKSADQLQNRSGFISVFFYLNLLLVKVIVNFAEKVIENIADGVLITRHCESRWRLKEIILCT